MAVDFLPQRLNPRRNRVNVEHCLNLQVYDPLIRRSGNQLTSEFIDLASSHPHSTDFKSYRLCLRDGVMFWDASAVTADDLAKSLADIHQEGEPFAPVAHLKSDGRCVVIAFERADPDYFDKLTVVASTVVKSGSEDDQLPTGRGAYKPISWTPAKVLE